MIIFFQMIEIVEVVLPCNIDDYDDTQLVEEDNVVIKKNKGIDDMLKEKPVKENNVLLEEEDDMEVLCKEVTNDYVKIIGEQAFFVKFDEESEEENSAFIKEEKENIDRVKEQNNTLLKEEKNFVKENPEGVYNAFIKEEEKMCAQYKEKLDLKDIKDSNLIIKEEEVIVAQVKKKPEEENSAFIKEGEKNVDWIKKDSVKEKFEEVDHALEEAMEICAHVQEVLNLEDTAVIDDK